LLSLQTEMKNILESKSKVILQCKSKYKEMVLKEVNIKMFNLKIIEPNAFKFLIGHNAKETYKVFMENLHRLQKFLDAFINPSELFEFMDSLREEPKIQDACN